MRDVIHLLVLALPALAACADEAADTDSDTAEFQQVAEAFQQLYIGGGENCERINRAVAEDVVLVENGQTWGREQMFEFCPHLPKKNVVDAWSDRTVISPGVGYEFVTVVYENTPADRRRETTVRVWRRTADDWKIIRMSSVLSAIPVENAADAVN